MQLLFYIFRVSAIALLAISTTTNAHAFGMLESVVTDIAKKQAVNVIAQNLIEEMVREEFKKSGIPFNHYDIETVVSAVKTNLGGNLTREDIPRITLAITRIMHETDRAKKHKMEQQQAAISQQHNLQQAKATESSQPQTAVPQPTANSTEIEQLRAIVNQLISRVDELERKLEGAQEYVAETQASPVAAKTHTTLRQTRDISPIVEEPVKSYSIPQAKKPEKNYSARESDAIKAFDSM